MQNRSRAVALDRATTKNGKSTSGPSSPRPRKASSSSTRSFRQRILNDSGRRWTRLSRRGGGAAHVLVTVFWHVRSTAALVARYRRRVWEPKTSRAAVERRRVVTDVFRPGVAPGRHRGVPLGPAYRGCLLDPEAPRPRLGVRPSRRRSAWRPLCPESWLPEGDRSSGDSPTRWDRCSTCRSGESSFHMARRCSRRAPGAQRRPGPP